MSLVRDPLFHFVLAGLSLFLGYLLVADPGEDTGTSKVIRVDRSALLTYIQYQSKRFDPEMAAQRLDAMDADQLNALIDAYAEEEVLHHEALSLELERDDYVIKQRLIQKLDFVTRGFAEQAIDISDAHLQAYFDAHRTDYAVAPSITFAQIFFDTSKRGAADAKADAAKLLSELNARPAAFEDAPGYGDRFPYLINYVERPPSLVVSHFGARAAAEILTLSARADRWQGPVFSVHGVHLVMVRDKRPGHIPDLETVRDRVALDAKRDAAEKATAAAVKRLREGYEVRLSEDLEAAR